MSNSDTPKGGKAFGIAFPWAKSAKKQKRVCETCGKPVAKAATRCGNCGSIELKLVDED